MSNPLLGGLVDPFTAATINAAVWNASSGSGVSLAAPGRVAVQATSAYPALGAGGPYEATGQSLSARVTPALAGTGGAVVQTIFKVEQDASDTAYFVCQPGSLWQAVVINAGVYTTVTLPAYDPTAHAWWQLTEASGQWLFSVSADGFSWAQLASIPYTWSPHAVSVYYISGSSVVTGETAYLEHVNTPAGSGSLLPSWPQVRFEVAFNTGGSMTNQPSYVDLSSRLRGSWSAELAGRQYELDQIQSGQATLSLWNLDGALDPTNSSSPYYPGVVPMRSCRLQAVWPPTRNLFQPAYASGTGGSWYAWLGTAAPATGLAPAPTGHTTALAWTFPVTSSGAGGWPLVTGATSTGADATAWPVVGGQPYALSLWLSRSTGGDPTVIATPYILWYDQTGAQIGEVGTTVTVPVQPAWAQGTLTATAPATAVSARIACWLGNTSTTAVNTFYITAMQLEQSAAVTPWTAGGVIYPMWSGYVERWPAVWAQQGTYGTIELTCVDLLAGLSDFTLQPSFQAQLQALGPSMLYPLDEGQGASQFADATGQRSARFPWAAPNGGAGASITSGTSVTGSGFVGAPGPVTTISNPTPGVNAASQAMYISAPWAGPWGPPTSGGWTRVISFRTPVTSVATLMVVWAASGPGAFGSGQAGSQAYLQMGIDSSGHFGAAISNAAGTATTSVSVPDFSCLDGNWHTAVIQLSSDGKTFTVACDNHGYQATTANDYHPTGCVNDTVGVLLFNSAAYESFSGDVAYITEFPYAIGNVAAFDLGNGVSMGWAGESSAARAQRILTMAGYGGSISAVSATTAMGGANLGGTDAMSALQLVADSEAGQVFVDASGTLWLTGRRWRYMQATATAVFGEEQASGEIPYLGDITVDFDPTHIYNAAAVTNVVAPGSPDQPVATAANLASQAAYLPRTLPRSINVQDTTQPAVAAQYLVQQYGQPLARVSQVTVDPASNPALWPAVLGLGFGSRVALNRRPGVAPEVSLQQFAEHLTWNGDNQGKLQLALQLTPAAPFTGWGLAAPMHTTLAAPATAGTNTITLSPLSGSASNTAASALPAGTVLTVGYGTAAAETVTVAPGGVATTSPGYTSVVVTLTANLASNHASGATVCQPLPGTVTLPSTVSYPTGLDTGATLTATGGPRAAY